MRHFPSFMYNLASFFFLCALLVVYHPVPSMTLRGRRVGTSVQLLAPHISHAMLLLYSASVLCVWFFCRVLTLSGGGLPLYGPPQGHRRLHPPLKIKKPLGFMTGSDLGWFQELQSGLYALFGLIWGAKSPQNMKVFNEIKKCLAVLQNLGFVLVFYSSFLLVFRLEFQFVKYFHGLFPSRKKYRRISLKLTSPQLFLRGFRSRITALKSGP